MDVITTLSLRKNQNILKDDYNRRRQNKKLSQNLQNIFIGNFFKKYPVDRKLPD